MARKLLNSTISRNLGLRLDGAEIGINSAVQCAPGGFGDRVLSCGKKRGKCKQNPKRRATSEWLVYAVPPEA
jgi:hypothetical protein